MSAEFVMASVRYIRVAVPTSQVVIAIATETKSMPSMCVAATARLMQMMTGFVMMLTTVSD